MTQYLSLYPLPPYLFQDAIVRHLDPAFIKMRLQKSPEAAGRNFMSYISCNYWLVKTFAEPFLNTSHTVQTVVHGSAACLQRSKSRMTGAESGLAESEEEESISKYEDERKGRNTAFSSSSPSSLISRVLYYVAIFIAYSIILMFIYASFTV
jgi:hypothetical protein